MQGPLTYLYAWLNDNAVRCYSTSHSDTFPPRDVNLEPGTVRIQERNSNKKDSIPPYVQQNPYEFNYSKMNFMHLKDSNLQRTKIMTSFK